MKLTIDYCTDCDYLDKSLEIVREVVSNHEDHIGKTELVPSDEGVLRVSIDGEILFDVDEENFSIDLIDKSVSKYIEDQE